MAASKTQRWLDLLAYLTPRHYGVTRAQIMEQVPAYAVMVEGGTAPEALRRTFERDKAELIALGLPLETVQVPGEEGEDQALYRLRSRDFYLPYLRIVQGGGQASEVEARPGLTLPRVEVDLDDLRRTAEAARAVRALPDAPFAPEADSAFRKLTFDLGPGWLDAEGAELVARGEDAPVLERTRLLHRAMAAGKTVRFDYTGAYRPGTEARTVHPYGLLFRFNRWYLVGHDVDRDGMRLFRLGRMDGLVMNTKTPGTPDFTRPGDFTLEPWRTAEPWSLPAADAEVTEVTARFDFPRSLLVERAGLGEKVGDEPGGVQLRRFRVLQTDAFLRWLLSLRGDGRIVDPPELDEAFRRLAGEVAALYRAEGA